MQILGGGGKRHKMTPISRFSGHISGKIDKILEILGGDRPLRPPALPALIAENSEHFEQATTVKIYLQHFTEPALKLTMCIKELHVVLVSNKDFLFDDNTDDSVVDFVALQHNVTAMRKKATISPFLLGCT